MGDEEFMDARRGLTLHEAPKCVRFHATHAAQAVPALDLLSFCVPSLLDVVVLQRAPAHAQVRAHGRRARYAAHAEAQAGGALVGVRLPKCKHQGSPTYGAHRG